MVLTVNTLLGKFENIESKDTYEMCGRVCSIKSGWWLKPDIFPG